MRGNTERQKHLDDKNEIVNLIKSRVLCTSVYLVLRVYIFRAPTFTKDTQTDLKCAIF